jgi:hypothetical protein
LVFSSSKKPSKESNTKKLTTCRINLQKWKKKNPSTTISELKNLEDMLKLQQSDLSNPQNHNIELEVLNRIEEIHKEEDLNLEQ